VINNGWVFGLMRLVHGVDREERIGLRERMGDLPTDDGNVDDAFVLVDADDLTGSPLKTSRS
jgi:hypothetical protein